MTSSRTANQTSGRPVRFIWACDAQSRLMTAALSPDHMLAPWAGQALLDNPAIREGSGALAGALLDHKTFSNLTVQWHAPDGVLESQLSGAPVNDRDGQFSGYRGFGTSQGLVHTAPQQPAPSKATLAKATPAKATPVKATPAAGFAGSGLSDREQQAFDEIGRLLAQAVTAHSSVREDSAAEPAVEAAEQNGPLADEPASHHSFEIAKDVQDLLDRLPVGVLVSRGDVPIVMNRLLLQSLDYPGADEFHAEGAITRLFPDQHEGGQGAEWMALTTRNGDTIDMRVMFQTIEWGQLAASMMVFVPPTLVLSGHETSETVPEPAAHSALVPASPDPMATQRISE